MSAKLYMDVHVPVAVTSAMRRRGFDVQTCQEDGTDEWDDEELLERTTLLKRVLFTQDADFLEIGSAWQATGKRFVRSYSHINLVPVSGRSSRIWN